MIENTELNPPRSEMLEYIKVAISEGYQPEHEAAINSFSVIDGLVDNDLNREFGKCWQWYNMGGGFHETFKNGTSNQYGDYRSEHLYNMKLQCLHDALIQQGLWSKSNAESIAETINAAFDKITF